MTYYKDLMSVLPTVESQARSEGTHGSAVTIENGPVSFDTIMERLDLPITKSIYVIQAIKK